MLRFADLVDAVEVGEFAQAVRRRRVGVARRRVGDGVTDDSAGSKGKAHGPEVTGGAAPKMHRRKAGGGGS